MSGGPVNSRPRPYLTQIDAFCLVYDATLPAYSFSTPPSDLPAKRFNPQST
jgi:hypothetical protein